MSPARRARLERLEALIDRAPDPHAWLELCAALSDWPDSEEIELGVEFVRARMHAWPRALRTAPEWWRMAWERRVPEPRLALAAAFEGPLLPATGGGGCPVQYDVYHGDRIYYLRCRHGCFSVDLSHVGGRFVDRELFDTELQCIESKSGGIWSEEETNVLLTRTCAAIRRGDLSTLELPDSLAAMRASEDYALGPYPLLVVRLPDGQWSGGFQPCNLPWMERVQRGEPVSAAVTHHLTRTRPTGPGPMAAPTCRVWFEWAPWSDPRPPADIVVRGCALGLSRRLDIVDELGIVACAFLDDDHVVLRIADQALYTVDLRTDTWGPPGDAEAAAAALASVQAPRLENVPDCVILDDDTRFVFLDDGRVAAIDRDGLRIWDPETGVCQAELRDFLEGVALVTRGALVVFGDDYGELWIFEVGPAEVVED